MASTRGLGKRHQLRLAGATSGGARWVSKWVGGRVGGLVGGWMGQTSKSEKKDDINPGTLECFHKHVFQKHAALAHERTSQLLFLSCVCALT